MEVSMGITLEVVKRKMKELGASKAQVDSPTVGLVLQAILDDPTIAEMYDAQKEFEEQKTKHLQAISELETEYKRLEMKTQALREERDFWYNNVTLEFHRTQNAIDKFNEELYSGETPEARDTLRRARVFIQSVDNKTAYDNTACIIGLSAILSNGAISPVEELSKINTKIPSPMNIKGKEVWNDGGWK